MKESLVAMTLNAIKIAGEAQESGTAYSDLLATHILTHTQAVCVDAISVCLLPDVKAVGQCGKCRLVVEDLHSKLARCVLLPVGLRLPSVTLDLLHLCACNS